MSGADPAGFSELTGQGAAAEASLLLARCLLEQAAADAQVALVDAHVDLQHALARAASQGVTNRRAITTDREVLSPRETR